MFEIDWDLIGKSVTHSNLKIGKEAKKLRNKIDCS